jgi:hypothetical protein
MCVTTLTNDFTRPCRKHGGVAEIKVRPWVEPTTAAGFALTASLATLSGAALAGWIKLYCDLKTGKAMSTGTTNRENGSFFWAQQVDWKYLDLPVELIEDMADMMKNNVHVAVKTNEGKYYLFGYNYGMAYQGTFDTGTALADAVATTSTFVGEEINFPVYRISQTVYDLLDQ